MDPENTPIAQPAVQTPAAPAVDPAAIAAAVAAGMSQHQQQLASEPRQMTETERMQYLQVFDPMQNGFLDSYQAAMTDPDATPEERKRVFEQMRDGVVNQSLRGAELFIDQRISALREEFQPIMADQTRRTAESLWEQFAAKNADLAQHRGLVDTVSVQLQQSGFQPKSLDEAFSRAAETTRNLLKLPPPPASNQTAPNTAMPRMTPTNTSSSAAGAPTETAPTGVASFFLNRGR